MRAPDEAPRIYVASLADYNAGRLHGRWIDAAQDIERVWAEVTSMLAASREPVAEEWAIHDYDNFGPVRLSEHESLERVAEIARGIADHGVAFACWAATLDTSEWDRLGEFDDMYVGTYDSIEAYAEELLDSLDIDTNPHAWAPELVAPFFSFQWRAFAHSLTDQFLVFEWDGQVHVFEP